MRLIILFLALSLTGYGQSIIKVDAEKRTFAGSTVGLNKLGIVYIENYEPEALAFFTATSITNDTVRTAINNFVVEMKDSVPTIWNEMVAFYPFAANGTRVGDSISHKYNLKNAETFKLTFIGGSHDGFGFHGLKTGGYAKTHIIPATSLTLNSTHLGAYGTKDTILSTRYDISAIDASGNHLGCVISVNTGSCYSYMYNNTASQGRVGVVNTDSRIFYLSSRTAVNSHTIHHDGTYKAGNTTTGGGLPNVQLVIGRRNNNGTFDSQSSRDYGCISIGGGISNTDAPIYSRIVERLMVALRRSNNVAYAYLDAGNTPHENYAILNGLIEDYATVEIGEVPTTVYEISQSLNIPSNKTITINATVKMMQSDTAFLTTNVAKGDSSFIVTDGSIFQVGQWVGVYDTSNINWMIYDAWYAWSAQILRITGNTIKLDNVAPRAYYVDSSAQAVTYQPVFNLDRVNHVTINGRGIIDGNRYNQAQVEGIDWRQEINNYTEQLATGTGINLFGCKNITITGISIKNCMKHGISLYRPRPWLGYIPNTNINLTNLYIKNSHEKNICVFDTDSLNIANVTCDSSTWEDGIMLYDDINNVWIRDYFSTYNYRYGLAWQQNDTGLYVNRITTIHNRQSGIRIHASDVEINNAIMSDRLEIAGFDYTVQRAILNNIRISGHVANTKSRSTVFFYGNGIQDLIINGLYMDGNSTTLASGAGIYSQVYEAGYPSGVVINGGYIRNHTGTVSSINENSDITFIDFTGL